MQMLFLLQEQAAHGREEEGAAEARRLARQSSLGAFVKRAIVLHGGKLVALAAWWAAAQRPGAIGWVYAGEQRVPVLALVDLHNRVADTVPCESIS